MLSDTCTISIHLAYMMLAYVIASIIYLLLTKKIGTPFRDAYKKYDELVKIKNKSAKLRKSIFNKGILYSVIILFLWKPFKKCYKN